MKKVEAVYDERLRDAEHKQHARKMAAADRQIAEVEKKIKSARATRDLYEERLRDG